MGYFCVWEIRVFVPSGHVKATKQRDTQLLCNLKQTLALRASLAGTFLQEGRRKPVLGVWQTLCRLNERLVCAGDQRC